MDTEPAAATAFVLDGKGQHPEVQITSGTTRDMAV